VKVTIYVEGGGDDNATLSVCRKGFATFFGRMLPGRKSVRIVARGSRNQAFKDFRIALESRGPDEAVVLLVDSEAPVADGSDPWKHLADREGDKWAKPTLTSHDDACLMVQCVEAWFLADPDALKKHYRKGIRLEKLAQPVNGNVESIPKSKILTSLKAALHGSNPDGYGKRDAFKIITYLDPEKVCKASRHAESMRSRLMKLTSAKKK